VVPLRADALFANLVGFFGFDGTIVEAPANKLAKKKRAVAATIKILDLVLN
jgi:hypothetical protein